MRSRSSSGGPAAITSSDRDTMVKALGMLGSNQDGEVLSAAKQAERLRHKLNTGPADRIGH